MRYPFEKHFLVCTGKRCNDEKHGTERGECIQNELKDFNKKQGRKASVRVCQVSCLDLCDHGPNMIADGIVYSHLDRDLAKRVYEGVCGDGPMRSDLELDPAEFAAGDSAAARR
ncbi:MAG TPA: (2Fe-2S) ferredoxin domain-containing protein [Thermoanaerobaculia bacterium]|nr:(2Fe-2S) ferredoxin domain-containing protein [Thermoanaerobaculia bacterium]